MLSKILLGVSLVLLALKFGVHARLRGTGLGARLRAFGRAIDRFVNIALVVIAVTYAIQLAIIVFSKD